VVEERNSIREVVLSPCILPVPHRSVEAYTIWLMMRYFAVFWKYGSAVERRWGSLRNLLYATVSQEELVNTVRKPAP
jgi:hypothetical protein